MSETNTLFNELMTNGRRNIKEKRLQASEVCFEQAIDAVNTDNCFAELAQGYHMLGHALRLLGKFDKAIAALDEAESFSYRTTDERLKAAVLLELGYTYQGKARAYRGQSPGREGLIDEAQKYFSESIRVLELWILDPDITEEDSLTARIDTAKARGALGIFRYEEVSRPNGLADIFDAEELLEGCNSPTDELEILVLVFRTYPVGTRFELFRDGCISRTSYLISEVKPPLGQRLMVWSALLGGNIAYRITEGVVRALSR